MPQAWGSFDEIANALLELTRVEIAYGGIHAVKGIDLHVDKGELVCLIGTNGAGKTTTLKGITGLQPVKDGTIRYAGENVTGRPAFELVRKGLAMVPEGRGVFGALTIEENLAMGAYIRTRSRGDQGGRRAGVRAVPALEGASAADRGHAVRRRAADARDGPGADVQAEAPAARRTFDGPCAAHGAEGLRDRAQGVGRGRHDPADRAECEARARGQQSRLRDGIRARSRSRATRGRCCTIPPSAPRISARELWRATRMADPPPPLPAPPPAHLHPRIVPWQHALAWYEDAMRLFKRGPGMWAALAVITIAGRVRVAARPLARARSLPKSSLRSSPAA